MRVSENWLKELVNPKWDTQTLCDSLTLVGLEVDRFEKIGPDFSNVVVGKIIDAKKHPNADKLQVTTIDIGAFDTLEIVCGAPNVRVGIKVACAKIGALLPNKFKIKKSKIRGVVSHGMLASNQELGLGTEYEGILELDDNAVIGTDLLDYLSMDDTCIEIDLTPNRGDCLSVYGLAREVAIISGVDCQLKPPAPWHVASTKHLSIASHNPEYCPVFCAAIVENFDNQQLTPEWMVRKLANSGLHSISLLVDISNYVMLEMGQPMHAFDLDKVNGNIIVRNAKDGEKIRLLSDEEVVLQASHLVVCDDVGSIALAGIMGGKKTAVQDSTTSVLFEAAHFTPSAIRGKARLLNMQTDASYRFERGVDPTLPQIAMRRAVNLLLAIAGGSPSELMYYRSDKVSIEKKPIVFDRNQIKRILGISITDSNVEEKLEKLGCTLVKHTNGWMVTPPNWRFDLEIDVDLIEELVRLYGYDKLPSQVVNSPQKMSILCETQNQQNRLKEIMLHLGFYEIISYSFVNDFKQEKTNPSISAINLLNPISQDERAMRTTLLVGLLNSVAYNLNRQAKNIKLFETGLCFDNSDTNELKQTKKIAGVMCGNFYPEQWATENRKVDFFDVKGVIEKIFDGYSSDYLDFISNNKLPFHQTNSLELKLNGFSVGKFGMIRDGVLKEYDISVDVFAFEIELEALNQKNVKKYKKISIFPSARRDLSLVLPSSVLAKDLLAVVYDANIKWLQDVQVFDLYIDKKTKVKSIGLSLIFQDLSRTLTDDEIEKQIVKLLTQLNFSLSINLRE